MSGSLICSSVSCRSVPGLHRFSIVLHLFTARRSNPRDIKFNSRNFHSPAHKIIRRADFYFSCFPRGRDHDGVTQRKFVIAIPQYPEFSPNNFRGGGGCLESDGFVCFLLCFDTYKRISFW